MSQWTFPPPPLSTQKKIKWTGLYQQEYNPLLLLLENWSQDTCSCPWCSILKFHHRGTSLSAQMCHQSEERFEEQMLPLGPEARTQGLDHWLPCHSQTQGRWSNNLQMNSSLLCSGVIWVYLHKMQTAELERLLYQLLQREFRIDVQDWLDGCMKMYNHLKQAKLWTGKVYLGNSQIQSCSLLWSFQPKCANFCKLLIELTASKRDYWSA